jgi:hypothetical protein
LHTGHAKHFQEGPDGGLEENKGQWTKAMVGDIGWRPTVGDNDCPTLSDRPGGLEEKGGQ